MPSRRNRYRGRENHLAALVAHLGLEAPPLTAAAILTLRITGDLVQHGQSLPTGSLTVGRVVADFLALIVPVEPSAVPNLEVQSGHCHLRCVSEACLTRESYAAFFLAELSISAE